MLKVKLYGKYLKLRNRDNIYVKVLRIRFKDTFKDKNQS
jgi:hypothetical protein